MRATIAVRYPEEEMMDEQFDVSYTADIYLEHDYPVVSVWADGVIVACVMNASSVHLEPLE